MITLDIQDPKTWRVLIVDDEPDNLEMVADTLSFFGVTVCVAENGQRGLDQLDSFAPNLILLDLSMPVMDGWETRARLREQNAHEKTPIIALTAHAMIGDRERAMAAGFDGYLTKPIAVPTLLQDIQAILRN